MREPIHNHPPFPAPPATVFLIGIGGVGMSGLAQLLCHLGYDVVGSDRQLTGPGREELLAKLESQGIRILPQDGRGVCETHPAAVIRSAAIEPDNPDLATAGSVPQFGRAEALASVLDRQPGTQVGVAGSCGKTTVTAWIASALRALGHPVLMVCGGMVRGMDSDRLPGNFAADPNPAWLVYEVDESDGSLTEFRPHYGILLNVGTDHFEREELVRLFGAFLGRCRAGAVIPEQLSSMLPDAPDMTLATFADSDAPELTAATIRPTSFKPSRAGITFEVPGLGCFDARQFGRHSAANAAAVLALLHVLPGGARAADLPAALRAFRGVRQRFELVGTTAAGTPVFNDYAHNAEKIHAAILTARDFAAGPLLIVFQPHGYGPLGFMREPLRDMLRQALRDDDRFVFLPVYYAGGTTSFRPRAEEVARDYREAGLPADCVDSREAAARLVSAHSKRATLVLVLGARDPSLPAWAQGLVQNAGMGASAG